MVNITPKEFKELGAVYDGEGVNFAIFSEGADYVELCLFDGRQENKLVLPARTDDGVWHGYVKDLKPGTRYGYRVHGCFDPEQGKRFNPNKLLLDPYAKELDKEFIWHDSFLGYDQECGFNSFSCVDSAEHMPKSIVVDEGALFNYPVAQKPVIPWYETIIYEAHVKGMTILQDEIYKDKQGNFAGLSEKKVIQYLKSLGVTSLELLPVFACCVDRYLGEAGLVNYCGYVTVGFFAPRHSYGSILEFKKMLNALHDAGIEVILDVVYNHTGDSDQGGPTLMFKGIDNAYYYRLKDDKSLYQPYSGCGNVLDTNKPYVKRMIQDSLKYWASLGVDGYRFDLASALARDENNNYSPNAQFFEMIKETKELDDLKLIAEPWDASGEGFQLGNYPNNFKQWNSHYRDTMRNVVSSKSARKGDIAYSLSGSDKLGNLDNNSLSVNYLFSHDGFTMNDYFSYSSRQNHANPWNNSDGPNENGFNCGVDGSSDDRNIIEERYLRMRNSFTMLFLSIGVPMFVAGDEIARTQQGNNNPYCQDNEISWINWNIDENQTELKEFVAKLAAFRHEYSHVFGDKLLTSNDIYWLNHSNEAISEAEWNETNNHSFSYLLEKKVFVVINLVDSENSFKMPKGKWAKILSTNSKNTVKNGEFVATRQEISIFTLQG